MTIKCIFKCIFFATNVIKTHLMVNQYENIAFFTEKIINISHFVCFQRQTKTYDVDAVPIEKNWLNNVAMSEFQSSCFKVTTFCTVDQRSYNTFRCETGLSQHRQTGRALANFLEYRSLFPFTHDPIQEIFWNIAR